MFCLAMLCVYDITPSRCVSPRKHTISSKHQLLACPNCAMLSRLDISTSRRILVGAVLVAKLLMALALLLVHLLQVMPRPGECLSAMSVGRRTRMVVGLRRSVVNHHHPACLLHLHQHLQASRPLEPMGRDHQEVHLVE